MTHNEKKLLRVFAALVLLAATGLTFFSRFARLKELESATAYYDKSLQSLEAEHGDSDAVKAKLTNLREGKVVETQGTERFKDLSATVAYLRSSLEREGLRPDRYTVTGKAPKRFIEFSLKARPVAFFRFLQKQANDRWLVEFASLTMKNLAGTSDYETVFRIVYED